jgi:hypothetical protein
MLCSPTPPLIIAALVESGWTPNDDDLRAMGGEFIEETRDIIEWKPYDVWWFPKEADQ